MHPIEEDLIGIGGTDIIAEEASGEAEMVDNIIDDEEAEEQESEEDILSHGITGDEIDLVVDPDLETNPEPDEPDEDDEDDHKDQEITIKIKFGGKD